MLPIRPMRLPMPLTSFGPELRTESMPERTALARPSGAINWANLSSV